MCFPVWILWDSCCRPMRHITSTHYSHNPAPPTTRSDGFLRTTTSSCCRNARKSNSSSRCCRNTRSCCNTRCCNIFRAKITPVQPVIFWRQVATLQQQHSSSDSTSTHMKVNVAATLGQKMSPCLDLLHEVAPAVPSAGRTRARTSCRLRRRDGKECRLHTHNGTKALIRHLRL